MVWILHFSPPCLYQYRRGIVYISQALTASVQNMHACTLHHALPVSHACHAVFPGFAVWLMQKCKWLQALKKRRDSGSSTASSSRSRDDLSLTSPLSRVVCSEIGKGRPAHLLQKICSAAVEEAGAENVSGSNLAPFISDVWGPVHGCR